MALPTLDDDDLDAIEQRAELAFTYGDTTALRAEDVGLLIYSCRELARQNKHLVALVHQARDRASADRMRGRR